MFLYVRAAQISACCGHHGCGLVNTSEGFTRKTTHTEVIKDEDWFVCLLETDSQCIYKDEKKAGRKHMYCSMVTVLRWIHAAFLAFFHFNSDLPVCLV